MNTLRYKLLTLTCILKTSLQSQPEKCHKHPKLSLCKLFRALVNFYTAHTVFFHKQDRNKKITFYKSSAEVSYFFGNYSDPVSCDAMLSNFHSHKFF